jgi:hypothetical protein
MPKKTNKKKSKKKTKRTAKSKSKKKTKRTVKSKSNKKTKKEGGDISQLLKIQSNEYSNFPMFKKLFINDMSKKHKPFIKIDDIKKILPYEYKRESKNMGLHIGQRKLLLSEVQFLNKNNKQKYCVYAGSAPSNKTHLLSTLFPDIKFILVDPNIFELYLTHNNKSHRTEKHKDITHIYNGYETKSHTYKYNKKLLEMTPSDKKNVLNFIKTTNYKIYIWEDYMEKNLAKFLKELGSTLFISDVRTKLDDDGPNDIDIIWNRSMVHNWISAMRPEMSMVKFRVPFYNNPIDFKKYKGVYENDFDESKKYGVDFYNNYINKRFCMSKAELYIQTWKGQSSTEMRGYITKKNITNIVSYNTAQLEDKLNYYNRIPRIMYHYNKNADRSLHFCNCNDCAIENTIWEEYMKNNKKMPQDIAYYIKMANKLTRRDLSKVHDINVYEPLNADTLEQMMSITNKSTAYDATKFQRGNVAPQ